MHFHDELSAQGLALGLPAAGASDSLIGVVKPLVPAENCSCYADAQPFFGGAHSSLCPLWDIGWIVAG